MSNLINPWLVDGFVDEQTEKSVQGCYTGSDYWEGERAADKALKEERDRLAAIRFQKQRLANLQQQLETCSPHHHRKKERLEQEIAKLKSNFSVK